MNNFKVRAISAIAMVLAMGLIYFFFEKNGVVGIIFAAVGVSLMELSRLVLPKKIALFIRPLYFIFVALTFFAGPQILENSPLQFVAMSLIFLSLTIAFSSFFESIEDVFKFLVSGLLSSIYLGLFPATILLLLNHNNGLIWFFALLSIVFSGDILAYIIGSRFGKHKIMPLISPKKTFEGSFGGLVGSTLAGLIFSYYFLLNDPLKMVALSVIISFFAQMGDLFESLLKRISGHKDSGTILPGHGGILDRIDGVLFAAPAMWICISFLNL